MLDAVSQPDQQNDLATLLRQLISLAESGPVEGLDREAAAKFIGISIRKFDDLAATGLLPEPASLGVGNCPRWSRTVLRAWLVAGSPARSRWVQVQDQAFRRIGGK